MQFSGLFETFPHQTPSIPNVWLQNSENDLPLYTTIFMVADVFPIRIFVTFSTSLTDSNPISQTKNRQTVVPILAHQDPLVM